MAQLMTGAIAMAFAVAAVFFFRFWKQTGDRLFGFFSLSFLVLSLNRVALGVSELEHWKTDYFYWIRFVAFALILWAIIDKNRKQKPTVPVA